MSEKQGLSSKKQREKYHKMHGKRQTNTRDRLARRNRLQPGNAMVLVNSEQTPTMTAASIDSINSTQDAILRLTEHGLNLLANVGSPTISEMTPQHRLQQQPYQQQLLQQQTAPESHTPAYTTNHNMGNYQDDQYTDEYRLQQQYSQQYGHSYSQHYGDDSQYSQLYGDQLHNQYLNEAQGHNDGESSNPQKSTHHTSVPHTSQSYSYVQYRDHYNRANSNYQEISKTRHDHETSHTRDNNHHVVDSYKPTPSPNSHTGRRVHQLPKKPVSLEDRIEDMDIANE